MRPAGFCADECRQFISLMTNPLLLEAHFPEPPDITDAQPQSGVEGAEVTFGATVTGTEPFTYAWDFGGGATPNTSTEASPTVTLGSAGTYDASLTVTNDYGEDSFPFTLVVLGWIIETVDSAGWVGNTTFIALDSSDNPHITYSLSGDLKYAYLGP